MAEGTLVDSTGPQGLMRKEKLIEVDGLCGNQDRLMTCCVATNTERKNVLTCFLAIKMS